MSDHTRLMELGAAEGEGSTRRKRQAFAGLVSSHHRGWFRKRCRLAPSAANFSGDLAAAALHIITVTRGLAVLGVLFGDELELRKIAPMIDVVLGKKGGS